MFKFISTFHCSPPKLTTSSLLFTSHLILPIHFKLVHLYTLGCGVIPSFCLTYQELYPNISIQSHLLKLSTVHRLLVGYKISWTPTIHNRVLTGLSMDRSCAHKSSYHGFLRIAFLMPFTTTVLLFFFYIFFNNL